MKNKKRKTSERLKVELQKVGGGGGRNTVKYNALEK